MPDTHLAMPSTLSALCARLLEAEAPQSFTTTSEASPNGTAAAAAAFARLLASGDQAMQPETEISDTASCSERKALSLRDALLGSSAVPSLGAASETLGGESTSHPDTELLALWDEHCRLLKMLDHVVGFDAAQPYEDRLEEVRLAFEATPARTPQGAAVKGRYLLIRWTENCAIENAMIGLPSPGFKAALEKDDYFGVFWNLIGDLERMADSDTELLSAFSAWVAIQHEMERVEGTMNDDDFSTLCVKADAAARHALTFAPITAVGMAAQFHLVAHLAFCSKRGDFTAVDYRDRDDEELQIMRPMFERAAEMTATLRVADSFADTVAAFQDEAPITLALPLEPTGRMVNAAASAACITPEQFQAAYAAAVEALKLERAA